MDSIDVTGLGNAIVDVLAHAEDAFLEEQELTKGTMALINEARAKELYAKMGAAVEVSGGSCGNTMAGIASLGGRGAYIGKVADDQLGEVFAHDIRAVGVQYDTAVLAQGAPTARCLILVTPDAQRTMNTFLGACQSLGPDDVDEELIKRSKVTYMEGYLWDPPGAKEAFLKASKISEHAGQKTSLSLSDPFCVQRHKDEFLDLVDVHVDILFANEQEICSLYDTDSFEAAAKAVRGRCELVVLTRGAKGSVILAGEETYEVQAAAVDKVVDTTGAGDLYAAGYLYGHTQGMHPSECGRIGSLCAAEVISHFGARPEVELRALLD